MGLRDAGTSRWFPSGFLQTEEIVSADAKGKLWDVQEEMELCGQVAQGLDAAAH